MNGENPLWLPKGSIRAILAILLTAGTMYAVLFQGLAEAGMLGVLATKVVDDYFKARKDGL